MIQAITETDLIVYVQTEDNRIDTSVASANIRHLFKFTNDMDRSIQYAYGFTENIELIFFLRDIGNMKFMKLVGERMSHLLVDLPLKMKMMY